MPPKERTAQPAIDHVVEAHARWEQAAQVLEDAKGEFFTSVKDYLDNEGGSATVLARELGVSRGRIYQYRNEARDSA